MMKNVKIINEAFSNCFSNFDLVGLNNLLEDDKKFSEISKNEFLIHVRELFESYKKEKIYNLSSKSITCNNCEKGCNGFIFIDETYKNFYSLIIKSKNFKIVDLIECNNFDPYSNLEEYIHCNILPQSKNHISEDEVPF